MVNIMAVNTQSFTEFAHHVNMVFSSTYSIILNMIFLYNLIGGIPAGAGLLTMIIFIPLNSIITSKSKKLQTKKLNQQDNRIKSINEMLSGIKVIKLYGMLNRQNMKLII